MSARAMSASRPDSAPGFPGVPGPHPCAAELPPLDSNSADNPQVVLHLPLLGCQGWAWACLLRQTGCSRPRDRDDDKHLDLTLLKLPKVPCWRRPDLGLPPSSS